jgi:four helix bundle protein
MAQSFRQLVAWQKAMEFVREIYHVTRTFPGDEIYGLTSQLRRAAVSVPSNIAEGRPDIRGVSFIDSFRSREDRWLKSKLK